MPYPRNSSSKSLFSAREDSPSQTAPEHYLAAHSDGGARGNPGPAGYGVVIQDQSGKKVAHLSEYLGHQTNNFAEYQGLIAALEYALQHGPKALKVISDSELLGSEAAFVLGEWHLAMSDGKTPHGLFTLVFRKFPDGWKIVHDHTAAAE